MMGEIYSNAKEVVVWLGNDKTDVENFLELFEHYSDTLIS